MENENWLLRHAEKGFGELLSSSGEKAALEYGKRLKQIGLEIKEIVTSHFDKNIKTSELISEGYGGIKIVQDDRLAYHFSKDELNLYKQNDVPEIIRCLISCPGSFLEDAIRTHEVIESFSKKNGNSLQISHNSNISGISYVLWLNGNREIENLTGRDTKPLEGIKISNGIYQIGLNGNKEIGVPNIQIYSISKIDAAFQHLKNNLPEIVKHLEFYVKGV